MTVRRAPPWAVARSLLCSVLPSVTPRQQLVETVSHNALSDNEEFNFFGVHGNTDKTPEIRLTSTGSVAGEAARYFSTPTTTAVWAPE